LQAAAQRALACETQAREAITQSFTALREQMVEREIATIPIGRLKDATDGRLRLGVLEQYGYRTVAQVLQAGPRRLESVPGVGPQTATQAYAAARQVAAAAAESINVRIDLDPGNPISTGLVVWTGRYDQIEKALSPIRDVTARVDRELDPLLTAAAPARGRLRWFFTGKQRKQQALDALQRLEQWAQHASTSGLTGHLQRVEQTAAAPIPPAQQVWKDFERRSAEYYGVLGEIVDLKLDVAAAEGFLPDEIVAKVHQQSLDDSHRRVKLRGYQSFGARFALVQRRVIIGDEMGLGKTVEAIAALAHLKSLGATHFLVVSPASVLVNWTREIRQHSTLAAYRVHGPSRDQELRSWIRRGDVAVTTFETLRSIALPQDVSVAMLVVDEAHYVKNPAAIRSRHTSALANRSDRVLFLTGTPMENRVEEFRALVNYLQPSVASRLDGRYGIVGPDAFRKAVAPVYLRRNQEDVLSELPDLVQVDEWEEFGAPDFSHYRSAVAAGNFMAMRQAAFASADPRGGKLKRLVELADEAGDNDHKVVVFSYFRSVLDTVHQALGSRAFGPLTGSVPANRRQELVDRFAAADGHAVLVSQIQAGGVGLNMQAASVAVLCEPQVKPTMESQAVARLHRMGQVRKVQVHRLLTPDSVDQRMLELLDAKQRLFDDYAAKSDTADSSPEAKDISEPELARRIVEEEQERLALSLMSGAAPPST
jgi:SNF2 family DNA or RNA helicase